MATLLCQITWCAHWTSHEPRISAATIFLFFQHGSNILSVSYSYQWSGYTSTCIQNQESWCPNSLNDTLSNTVKHQHVEPKMLQRFMRECGCQECVVSAIMHCFWRADKVFSHDIQPMWVAKLLVWIDSILPHQIHTDIGANDGPQHFIWVNVVYRAAESLQRVFLCLDSFGERFVVIVVMRPDIRSCCYYSLLPSCASRFANMRQSKESCL